MKNIISLIEEVEVMLRKKTSVCNCNPCTCSEKTKAKYFRELKRVLERYNKKTLDYRFSGRDTSINKYRNFQ